ncbi:MAG: hypothetical protein K9I94_09860 [Bacteroidales bacterium]|nr:hypothetical protein [Bacteroidales bacterium]
MKQQRRAIFTSILIFSLIMGASAQEAPKKLSLHGYIKDMQTLWVNENAQALLGDEWITETLLHNRLNFKWYTSSSVTTVVEARNRFIYGEFVENFPDYASYIDTDYGYFDLSTNLMNEKNYLFHTMIDRAYVDYVQGDWQLTVGRQRVNWGIGLVWNPNDVFNTFSYFDFDYEERPGTDAIKVTYYPNYTSSADLVYELGETWDKSAIAGQYRFNKWNYDFQVLGGMVKTDWVLGAGWTGDISGAGFRGEMTWFHPRENFADTSGIFVATIGGDYTWKSGLYVHGSFLFNSNGATGDAGGFNYLMGQQISAKMLSPAKYSTFGQVNYPFTPLINGGISAIFNPSDHSVFAGPSVDISISNNTQLLINTQLFFGEAGTEFGNYGQFFFARFKHSF